MNGFAIIFSELYVFIEVSFEGLYPKKGALQCGPSIFLGSQEIRLKS